jgi:hypothetical protein
LFIIGLLLGVGAFASAQNCPSIGTSTGTDWAGESTRISWCSPAGIQSTPVPPDSTPTFGTRLKRTTTTYFQEPGSCFFTAFHTVTWQSDDQGNNWYTPDPVENSWFTGIITPNGKKMSMQAQPGPNNPGFIVYADITKLNKITKMATEMTFTTHASLGVMGSYDDPNQMFDNKCSYTTTGRSTRLP